MIGRASARSKRNPPGFWVRSGRATAGSFVSLASHLSIAFVISAALAALMFATHPTRSMVERVERRVEATLGGKHDLSIGKVAWSFDQSGITLKLHDLTLAEAGRADPHAAITVASVLVRPRSVLLNDWSLSEVSLETLRLRTRDGDRALPDLDALERTLRERAPDVLRQFDAVGLETVEADAIEIVGGEQTITLDHVSLSRSEDGFDAAFGIDTRNGPTRIHANIGSTAEFALIARTVPMPVSKLYQRRSFATSALLGLTLSVPRDARQPLSLVATSDGGPVRLARKTMIFDGLSARATLLGGTLSLSDLDLQFGLNRLGGQGNLWFDEGTVGYEIDFRDVVLNPADVAYEPLYPGGKVVGTFDLATKLLTIGTARLETDEQVIDAAGHVRFVGRSPEIALDFHSNSMKLLDLPTLWPSWIGAEGRDWMIRNVRDGVAEDAQLAVRIASDRLHEAAGRRLRLEPNELRVSAELEGASSSLFGDLPTLKEARGEFAMAGRRMEIALEGGTLPLADGAAVAIGPSWLTVPDLAEPDLPVGFDIGFSGGAEAVAALADREPFKAMRRAKLDPAALSGRTSGRVKGDVALRNIEQRDWSATIGLDRVSVARPIEGREFADVTGVLTINETRAVLEADGMLDGVRAHFSLNEPLVPAPSEERQRGIELTLDREAMDRFVPGLSDYVGGAVVVRARQTDEGFAVDADLSDAAIDLPWIGWRKGRGVAGRATFDVSGGSAPSVSNLVLSGDGFGARGDVRFDAKGLASLTLREVRLAPGDSFSVALERRGSIFGIDVNGERADLRSLIRKLDPRHSEHRSGKTIDFEVSVRLNTAVGFNEVSLNDVALNYASKDGALAALTLRAGFMNGARLAVDGSGSNGSEDVFVTSGDLGRTLRFLDLYTKMRGGTVTANALKNGGIWRGFVDGSDIELVGESKLDILAKRARRERGRTLDVGQVRFSRAFADFAYGAGQLEVSEAILRGPEIGAALDGVVIDANKTMNLRGTFLPAYGLNRVFSEVPVVGALLGNGKDKGLFGLTFRLSGPALRPTIEVNPLSLMAPGVFRNVFEYQP